MRLIAQGGGWNSVGIALGLVRHINSDEFPSSHHLLRLSSLIAGVAGWIAYQMWQRVAASVAPVPSGILLALSAALAAFCLYNVVAGGNPPPSQKQV